MNIVFWSKASGKGATSGNMLAVSIMSSLVYSVKGILVQLDYCSRSIDDVFNNRKQTNLIMEEYAYYNQKGIDELLDKNQIKEIDVSDVRENVIPVKNTNMSYLPTSRRIRSGINEKEIVSASKTLMNLLNQAGQYNFIDCINGDRPVSRSIIKSADVVVINICQGMNIDDIVRDKALMKKAVFLVGRYDENSNDNVAGIRKRYGIDKDSIGVIPYNIGFHDSIEEGKVVPYLIKHISARRTDENFAFINSVFRSANMVLRKAGFDERFSDVR